MPSSGRGVSAHGQLTGLPNDDHTQYYNAVRLAAWLLGITTDDLLEGAANFYSIFTRPDANNALTTRNIRTNGLFASGAAAFGANDEHVAKLSDNGGTKYRSTQDSAGTEVETVDSDGNMHLAGQLNTGGANGSVGATIKLGDAAGADSLQILDNVGAEQFKATSDGKLVFENKVLLKENGSGYLSARNATDTADYHLRGSYVDAVSQLMSNLIRPRSAANLVFKLQGANNYVFQDSSSNEVASISSTGVLAIVSNASYGGGETKAIATCQTTDATVTDIATIAVAEGEVVKVEATVIAQETDESNRALYHKEALFYRATAGNVTQQGATASIIADIESDAAWDFAFAADTGNQTVDLRVTGAAATPINWKAIYKYSKVTTS